MRRRSAKKLLLKILQNSQENICVGVSFLIKLQASEHFLYRTPPVAASEFPRRFSKIFRCTLFTTSCECCFVLRKISKLIQNISYFLQQNICVCVFGIKLHFYNLQRAHSQVILWNFSKQLFWKTPASYCFAVNKLPFQVNFTKYIPEMWL